LSYLDKFNSKQFLLIISLLLSLVKHWFSNVIVTILIYYVQNPLFWNYIPSLKTSVIISVIGSSNPNDRPERKLSDTGFTLLRFAILGLMTTSKILSSGDDTTLSRKLLSLMTAEGSFLPSREYATGPCSEPSKLSLYPHVFFLQYRF
jgi:hypothetical protein